MTHKQQAALERLKTAASLPPGERLCALREALGLAEATLARRLQVTGPAVHAWEHGKQPTGANPTLIEAWSREAARDLGLNVDAAIAWWEWLPKEEQAKLISLTRSSLPSPEAP